VGHGPNSTVEQAGGSTTPRVTIIIKAGIDAYMAVNGNTVGSDTVEILYRHVP
jgi:hypothetical protein